MGALRAARALAGLSQEELVVLAGVSRQIVARIEKGESNVLVDAIEKVRVAHEGQGSSSWTAPLAMGLPSPWRFRPLRRLHHSEVRVQPWKIVATSSASVLVSKR
jgi:transcriptional regulator with XRE-family HTH domain